MKPPSLDRLRIEDFPDAPEWLGILIEAWNGFIESVTQILSRRITFYDNFEGQEYEDDITQLKLTNGYRFKSTMRIKPRGIILLQIYKVGGNHDPITTAPYIDWTYSEGLITIHSIAGIDSDATYRVRLQVV